jgi:hypothetical protein
MGETTGRKAASRLFEMLLVIVFFISFAIREPLPWITFDQTTNRFSLKDSQQKGFVGNIVAH